MVSRLEAASGGRVAALEAENDRLRLEIAERDRRMAKYENAHVPSSTGSLYNEKRAAFRKMMAEEDGYCDEGGDMNRIMRMAVATAGRWRVSRPAGDRRPDT